MLTLRSADVPFAPWGRRWPEGPDEGSRKTGRSFRPLIRLALRAIHLPPQGEEGWRDALRGVLITFCCTVAALLPHGIVPAQAASPLAAPVIQPFGPPTVLFDPARDGCDGNDVPDAPARVFRNADGNFVLFGLHFTNHPLVGPSLDSLKVVCRSAFQATGNGDPAAYDDKSWVAATWTRDGTLVDALLHHEYQGDSHPGRCRFPGYLQCWFNTVLAARSVDGGASFVKADKPVVASAPFPQEFDQGRHRGFFNPSNIFSDGRFVYTLIATTGWSGQDAGACLFRARDPDDPGSWRAYDGADFTIRYDDPYRRGTGAPWPKPCATMAPFPAPVGSVVRLRGTGTWVAVFQAAQSPGRFPQSGFYAAASRDFVHWSEPRLLLAGTTNYESPCHAGGAVIAYPSLVDPDAIGLNFDNVGGRAVLLYTSTRADGCTLTGDRKLMRQPVVVQDAPG